jgi:hypothetical protein
MKAQCPKCDNLANEVRLEETILKVDSKKQLLGLVYSCQKCNTVLSIQIDPFSVKDDIVDALFERLRK